MTIDVSGLIHSSNCYTQENDIREALNQLHSYPVLACDIETTSLDVFEGSIVSIGFAWDKHNGIVIDLQEQSIETQTDYLVTFFNSYKGKFIFHNAAFDIKYLITRIYCYEEFSTDNVLRGLENLTRDFDDTLIIAYLATNSTAGNSLSLKSLAKDFAGGWKVDFNSVNTEELLRYNLIDCLATWYVYETYYPKMQADNQEDIYRKLFLPTQKLIIQMELTGIPLDLDQVHRASEQLSSLIIEKLNYISDHPSVKMLNFLLQESAWDKDYQARKAKAKNPGKILPKNRDVFTLSFNPNSGPQMQRLLYEQMALPILDVTDTKQPATGKDVLEKLIHRTDNPDYKDILLALIEYKEAHKIHGTFIAAFLDHSHWIDNCDYLHGSFNVCGTVSGRLSSSDPNLQNIPSTSTYGKLIKECVVAPKGWLFAGADFNSLEDYISALTTKDPNKLAVYEKGFDGHCLRAAYYFKDQLPHIDINDPDSVNSIKKTHPELRQQSKGPTFALTYQGTWHTLVNTLGFSEEQAKAIEEGYHNLYKVSDDYVQARLHQASKDGYVDVAFGLRVRTPLLSEVVYGASKMPYNASAEARTAGNALGQSYCLLNNRAAVDFFNKVWASSYRLDIKPVALIHDAIYILIRDDVRIIEWANRELVKSMQWQELPEIQHPTVRLGANLDIFWPNWANPITLPNNADQKTIIKLCTEAKEKHNGQ